MHNAYLFVVKRALAQDLTISGRKMVSGQCLVRTYISLDIIFDKSLYSGIIIII